MKVIDINDSFKNNPITGSFSTVYDINAIKQSVYNILQMKHFEKPYNPEFGLGINNLLGEPISAINASLISEQIKELLSIYETRIELQDVEYELGYEEQRYHFILYYVILDSEQTNVIQSLNLYKVN